MHNIIAPALTKTMQLLRGQSYWQVKLTTGKTFSELDEAVKFEPDPVTGRLVARNRKIDWFHEIIASGDTARIAEVHLITPQGDACMHIAEPHTAFQLKRGTAMPFSGERIMNCQIIGRVDDRETGECTATIWDVLEQKLYVDHITNVQSFSAWRKGIPPVGMLDLEVVGVRLSK